MAYATTTEYETHPHMSLPAAYGIAITPSDTVALAMPARAIYVGVTGNVALLTVGGDTVTFVGVPAGTVLPVRTLRVNSTGTTATSLVALR